MSDGKKHALLAPSASHCWIACPPSARLTENYEDIITDYSKEGTQAHAVAEVKLKHRLGQAKTPCKCDDLEMDEHTDDYVAFVMEQLAGLAAPKVFVEYRVDCSIWIPECFGTCDALIVSDGILHIIDFKYGNGVKVNVEGNSQLRIYALGALAEFGFFYSIDTVRLSIFQPRLANCATWEVSGEDVEKWAMEVLKPAAELAWHGNGDYKAGDHCQFCKARAECRERANANMALAAYDFTDHALLKNDEIAAILDKVDGLVLWASDVKKFALAQALNGVKYKGWKVVEGRSNRIYTDEAAVAAAVQGIGFDPYEHKVLGITAMTDLLGKKRFQETLGKLLEKPKGKPTLVSVTDKRQETNITTAADDFAGPIEN